MYFLINVVLQTWHFIHKIINPQICRQFFSLTTPATLGKTTLRIRLRLTFFATSAPSGQVDSKVGLAILVICIITLLADLLFIGLIFSEKQLLYQVLTKLMWNKKIRGVSQAYKNQILIQLPNAFVMDMVSKKTNSSLVVLTSDFYWSLEELNYFMSCFVSICF